MNVNKAGLQSTTGLQKKIFIKSVAIKLGPDDLSQLFKSFYVLHDSENYWYETNYPFRADELRIKQNTVF